MLKPRPTPPIPKATARAARAAFPKGNRYIILRDELGTVFNDEMFDTARGYAKSNNTRVKKVAGWY